MAYLTDRNFDEAVKLIIKEDVKMRMIDNTNKKKSLLKRKALQRS